MTLHEYQLRNEVYRLQRLDTEEHIALMAFYNQLAQSTTGGKNPRIKFDSFNKLFDRAKAEAEIFKMFGDEDIAKSVDGTNNTVSFAEQMKKFNELKEAGKIDMNAWKKLNRKGGG